jgi:hypothetical protein
LGKNKEKGRKKGRKEIGKEEVKLAPFGNDLVYRKSYRT